jgi:molybdopterin-containing oxidoreductase family molybdopterin binding subunit
MTKQTIVTSCAHNCGGRALLRCTVRDERLIRVEPADHPDPAYTGACVRCLALPGWVYGPNRIETPMMRVGERGDASFRPVSWEVALDAIATRLQETIDQHGPERLAFTRTSGASLLGNYTRLQSALGATQLFGSVDMAVHMGLNSTLGFKGLFNQAANEWTDRPNARTVIVWGHNPAETSMTVFRWLLDAQRSGTRLVVIDPRYSTTARHADWWLAPRPGTDAALALGMLHVCIEEGLVDEDFARAHTCGPLLVDDTSGRYLRADGLDLGSGGTDDAFLVWDADRDEAVPADSARRPVLDGAFPVGSAGATTAYRLLRRQLEDYAPDQVEKITGIPEIDLRDLARVYATETPSTIAFGYGVDRYQHGDLVTRAGATLAVLTGNIGAPGASVGVASHGIGFLDRPPPSHGAPRSGLSIPNSRVGQEPIDVRTLFSVGDYLNQRVADQNRALEWLRALDFVVVVDHFWNTTSRYADVVLPASTFLEGDVGAEVAGGFEGEVSDEPGAIVDLQSWGNSVFLKRAVIPPVHDSRPDRWIETQLALRMGLDGFDRSAAEEIRERLAKADDPTLAGIDLDALVAAGGAMRRRVPTKPNIQYEDLSFGTPSGRAEFYLEDLVDLGEALPIYRDDHEASAHHPRAQAHPLVLTQSHARQRAHSTFSHNPWLLAIWPEPRFEINPDDAAARGIADDDLVEVFNERGNLVLKALCNPDYPPGLCNVTEGWKGDQYAAGHLQQLVNGALNPVQERLWDHSNLPFSDTRVEVRRVDAETP